MYANQNLHTFEWNIECILYTELHGDSCDSHFYVESQMIVFVSHSYSFLENFYIQMLFFISYLVGFESCNTQ